MVPFMRNHYHLKLNLMSNYVLVVIKKNLSVLLFLITAMNIMAQTDSKVGTTPGAKTPSAVFEVESTTKGFLMPRLTAAQMNAISSPATGLMIFNTTDSCVYLYRGSIGGWNSTCALASASAWSVLGNTGTVDGTNFIGTTDNIPFNFKVNNQKAGRIGINGETFLGYQAGNVNTGANNTFTGYQSGLVNTTGSSNVGVGTFALDQNTTAWSNTAVGFKAMHSNTTASGNTAVGDSALFLNTIGANNTTLGYRAGSSITTGSNNIVIGNAAQVPTQTVSNQLSIGNWIYGVSGSIGIGTTSPNATLDVSGSFANAITTTATNLTLDATHHTIIVTSSTPTITFPAASTCPRREYVILNQSGGTITTSTYLKFDASNATTIATKNSITIQSDGTNWYLIHLN